MSNTFPPISSQAIETAPLRQNLKFAVIHMGARLHYAVPSVLADAGMLQALYMDACANTSERLVLKWWPHFLRPAALRRFASRQLPANIPNSAVRGYVYPTIQQYVFDHLAGRRSKSTKLLHSLGIGGHALARKACAHHFHGANALYVHPCASTDAIHEAKRRGLFIVLEAISHPFNKRVEAVEYKKYGERLPYNEAEIEENIAFFKMEALQANLVLAASPFVRAGLIELGLAAESIAVVPYGLEKDFFNRSPEPRAKRVLYVGNVGYLKGVHYLAEAARLLSKRGFSAEVRIVGPYDRHLLQKPEFTGPTFIGPRSRTQVRDEFLAADVFVFPTLSDGFGIVLLEAMAAGVPVISTRNCGAVVRDGENGFIVPNRDAQAIAERIEQITTDRNLRERLSHGASATATQFSLTQYKERLVSAIRHAAI